MWLRMMKLFRHNIEAALPVRQKQGQNETGRKAEPHLNSMGGGGSEVNHKVREVMKNTEQEEEEEP